MGRPWVLCSWLRGSQNDCCRNGRAVHRRIDIQSGIRNRDWQFLFKKAEKGSPVHIFLLKHAAVRLSSIKAFQELKKYISPEEARLFIDSVYNPEYRIKLLNNEKQYDKIKEIISRKLSKDSYYTMAGFNKSIQYLYIPDPDAAIRLTKQNINLAIESRRNRDTYQYIAEFLKQLLANPGKTSQVKSNAKDLYNHKPNLPALKDELRKASLIQLESARKLLTFCVFAKKSSNTSLWSHFFRRESSLKRWLHVLHAAYYNHGRVCQKFCHARFKNKNNSAFGVFLQRLVM